MKEHYLCYGSKAGTSNAAKTEVYFKNVLLCNNQLLNNNDFQLRKSDTTALPALTCVVSKAQWPCVDLHWETDLKGFLRLLSEVSYKFGRREISNTIMIPKDQNSS